MTTTTIEEQENALKRKIKKRINDEMWERNGMKQFELAEMIGEGFHKRIAQSMVTTHLGQRIFVRRFSRCLTSQIYKEK